MVGHDDPFSCSSTHAPPLNSLTSADFIIPNLPANKLYPTKKKDYTVTTPSHRLRLHVNYKILIFKNQDPPPASLPNSRTKHLAPVRPQRLSESLKVGHLHLDFEKGLRLFKTTDKVVLMNHNKQSLPTSHDYKVVLMNHNKQSLPTSHDNQSLSYQVAKLKKWSTTTHSH